MRSCKVKLLSLLAGLIALPAVYAQTFMPRIVGGVDTTPQTHPTYVVILADGSLCGGTLIDSRWVLTASHCLERDGVPANLSKVFVGILPSGIKNNVIQASDWISASSFQLHPNYSFPKHDIALIKLSRAAQSATATLGTYSDSLIGTVATVVGLGSITRQQPDSTVTDQKPSVLQQANVPIVNSSVCTNFYGSTTPTNLICGGYNTNPNSEACFGDSGGPLYLNQNGKKLQAGLVSFGSGCGVGNPGGYLKISEYESFIKKYVPAAAFASTRANNTIISDVTGAWYDPSKNGVGFNVIQAGNTLSVMYYGYRNTGLPQWLISVSTYNQDIIKNTPIKLSMNTATNNNGATFTNPPQTTASGTSSWGELTLSFTSCSIGTATLNGKDGKVTYQLNKLTHPKNLSCSD